MTSAGRCSSVGDSARPLIAAAAAIMTWKASRGWSPAGGALPPGARWGAEPASRRWTMTTSSSEEGELPLVTPPCGYLMAAAGRGGVGWGGPSLSPRAELAAGAGRRRGPDGPDGRPRGRRVEVRAVALATPAQTKRVPPLGGARGAGRGCAPRGGHGGPRTRSSGTVYVAKTREGLASRRRASHSGRGAPKGGARGGGHGQEGRRGTLGHERGLRCGPSPR